MPFGLKNATGTFQRVMDVILSPVKWQFDLVYVNDIVVYLHLLREHINHLRHTLSLLQDA